MCNTAGKRWRKRSEICWRFFDGQQWSQKDIQELAERGQRPIVDNLVAPTIESILSLHTSNQQDIICKPQGANDLATAEKATASLKFVMQNNNGYQSLARAYQDLLVYGFGVVHVGKGVRDSSPFVEPVQLLRLDPREISIDPESKQPDLSDCKFVVWSKWADLEDLEADFPQFKEVLRGNSNDAPDEPNEGYEIKPSLGGWNISYSELWKFYETKDGSHEIDKERKRVKVHEIWYRTTEMIKVVKRIDGTVSELTEENLSTLLDPTIVSFETIRAPKIRQSILVGDLLLSDNPSPYKSARFPFVVMRGKTDINDDPLPLVELLREQQIQVNNSLSRMAWELACRKVIVDPEAIGTDLTLAGC
jgi:hypothetical protein